MKTVYCKTRDAARILAREEGGKFQDFGKDNTEGRWGVIFTELKDLLDAPVLQRDPTPEEIALADLLNQNSVLDIQSVQDDTTAALKFAMRKADLKAPESVTRRSVTTLTDRKGNRVEVITRRRIAV